MSYRNGNHLVLNVSSLPNTLNNRISFQIAMGGDSQFLVKQIVWAKVGDYPWWPARIVKSIVQRSRNIYKVHFFGDPTYCYLQSQRLLDFKSGLASFQDQHSIDLILKRPIQLAKAAYKKLNSDETPFQAAQEYFQETQHIPLDCFQQSKAQSKFAVENLEKVDFNDQIQAQFKIQESKPVIQFGEINTHNVIQLITGPCFRQLKSSKGYNNRKNVLSLELELKHTLLSKYKLHEISKANLVHSKTTQTQKIRRKRLINVSQKINKKKNSKNAQQLFLVRKLCTLIRQYWNVQNVESQQMSIKIVDSLNRKWVKDRKSFRRNYMKIIQSIKHNERSFDIVQYLLEGGSWDMNKKYGNFEENTLGLEEQYKKQDQEKSKVTQLQPYIH